MVRAILYENFVPLRTYPVDAPEALEQDVSQRYADCRAMAADLEKLLLARNESATPYKIAQLVQRLGGPTTIALAPTLPPNPHGSVPQAATMPMEPTHAPAKTAVEVMPPPPAQTMAGATTPHPQVKVIEPALGAFATIPTPAPRDVVEPQPLKAAVVVTPQPVEPIAEVADGGSSSRPGLTDEATEGSTEAEAGQGGAAATVCERRAGRLPRAAVRLCVSRRQGAW